MKAKIYRPAKSAMQSGKARSKKWICELLEEKKLRRQDSLMGWVNVDNTASQLHFEFASKDEAIAFAKKSGFSFEVVEPLLAKLQKKSYADNFC